MWPVVGQDRVLSLLQKSLEQKSLAHAYLVVGRRHVGKMTLALELAKALNCEAAKPPCGECPSCQKITDANHADVHIIGVARDKELAEAKPRVEIGIDQIKEMQHSASLPPFEGKYKMFIVDGAELLSIEAANCLLKTLEEPADRIIFILLAANERLLPATVVSRCQRLELSPLTAAKVEATLTNERGVAPQKAKLLARLCHGCLGWAITADEDDGLLRQRREEIDRLANIISAGYEERFAYASQLATIFSQNRGRVEEVLELWLDWWHDLLLVKTGLSEAITNIDLAANVADRAGGYSLAQIKNSISSIQAAGEQLRQNANPRLVLEVLMLNMPRKESSKQGATAINYG